MVDCVGEPGTTVASVDKLPPSHQLNHAKFLLKQGKLISAIGVFEHLLSKNIFRCQVLYYLAVCQRKMQKVTEALKTLAILTTEFPDYARAYQEEGHNHLALGDVPKAITAFEGALAINPALVASWGALDDLYHRGGQVAKCKHVKEVYAYLQRLPAELLAASSLVHEKNYFQAEKICRHFLQQNLNHKEGMRLLAEIGSQLHIFDDAEFLLESCVGLYPDYSRARLDYALVLHKRQKFDKSLLVAKGLYDDEPNNPAFAFSLATAYQALGEFTNALAIYDKILLHDARAFTVHAARGHALKTIGRTEDAITAYQNAYQYKLDYGDAYWSLANLKTYQFTDNEIQQMQAQEARPGVAPDDKVHLCFALGKAFEDRKTYDSAFRYYVQGNALKKKTGRYKADNFEKECQAQRALFDTDFFAERQSFGCENSAPIFIVGLPRAGSTLLEQILASHSEVDGTMELSNIIGLAHRLQYKHGVGKQPYPKVLETMSKQQALEFGQQYIEETQIHRQGACYFIDKMPNNFRHIALIQLILPNAKIIDARRNPMACCFSGFKQLFAEGQEFTYALEDVGHYYQCYVDLMRHWDAVLPGKILRVQHEDMVNDTENQVRRVLEFCGLGFEMSCLEFHKTDRAIRTPSSEQVRKPIYRDGLEQWTNFESYLSPLKEALGPALENYRY